MKGKSLVSKFLTAGLLVTLTSTVWAQVLEEIVVTAAKRQESLQEVNMAVTAVTGLTLERRQIDTIEDIQMVVPSMSAGNDFAFAKLFIRGIGLNSSFAGVDPSVALHVDGAVISSSYAQLGAFFDLERVEVLRGPQGTLYGKNATGGSVNLVSRKPTEEFGGYGRLTLGNYDLMRLEGAVGGQISDNVLGRIAFKSTDRNGYGTNILTGNDIDDANKQAFRGHLQFDTGSNSDVLLTAEWQREDDAGMGIKLIETLNALNPVGFPNPPVGEGGFAPGRRDTSSEKDNENKRESLSFTGTWNWQINDTWRLQSITNWRDTDILLVQDLDNSSNVNATIQSNFTNSEQLSQELQLQFETDRMNGLIALYYFDEAFKNNNNIGFALPSDGRTTNVLLTGDIDVETVAVFAHMSYNVSDTFSINVGGRFAEEDRGGDNTFPLFFIPLERSFSDSESFSEFKPSVGFEWKPRDGMLAYFTYSEGFKGGGFQSGQLIPILRPELVDNYEVGLKGTYAGGRLLLNLAGFVYEVTDMQLDRTVPNAGGGFSSIFENAAEAEGRGIEIEASLLATENFRIDGNISILDTEFVNYVTNNPIDGAAAPAVDLAGNKLRQAPEFSGYIRGEYEHNLAGGGSLTWGAQVSHTDDQFYTEFNDSVSGQEAFTLFDANVLYSAPGGRMTVNVWGNNLGDEFVVSGAFVSSTGFIVSGNNLPPRTYGVTFGYEF
ncbi:MAG: TonB-dependent receptor [Gammaproteobacteria bacterium]|nr:TonB-dependent receptor [Gammaproteobacteria bacterium]